MLKYTIASEGTAYSAKPGSTNPLEGKVSMTVTFTDSLNNDSSPQYFEVDSLDPVVIDAALKAAAIDYNNKVLVQAQQAVFDNPFDMLTVGTAVEFDDDGTPGEGTISGVVWNDSDMDGLRGGVYDGIAGVTVELYLDEDDSLVDTDTTDGSGAYSFTDVEGSDYYLKFTAPSGYAITLQDQGADDTVDSDADPTTGVTASFTLENDTEVTGIDAGMYQLGTISGIVWDDVDEDGTRGIAEMVGFDALDVELRLSADSSLIDTVATDIDGNYTFEDIVPGNYYVAIPTLPANYVITAKDVGEDDTIDSDFDPVLLATDLIPVTAGGAITNVDCGLYYNYAHVTGSIFDDWNRDGVWDSAGDVETLSTTEVLVEVRNVSDDELVSSATVNTGLYDIPVPAGEYYVKITPPEYWELSPDTSDSDVDPTTLESDGFIVALGAEQVVDVGVMREVGTVTASVFIDDGAGGGTPDDGIQNGDEIALLTGADVYLRVTNPLTGFWDDYPDIADGSISVVVHAGVNLTAEWIFTAEGSYATGYHMTGLASNPETGITVTSGGTTALGARGIAAD